MPASRHHVPPRSALGMVSLFRLLGAQPTNQILHRTFSQSLKVLLGYQPTSVVPFKLNVTMKNNLIKIGGHTGRGLKDMIFETERGKYIFFVDTDGTVVVYHAPYDKNVKFQRSMDAKRAERLVAFFNMVTPWSMQDKSPTTEKVFKELKEELGSLLPGWKLLVAPATDKNAMRSSSHRGSICVAVKTSDSDTDKEYKYGQLHVSAKGIFAYVPDTVCRETRCAMESEEVRAAKAILSIALGKR